MSLWEKYLDKTNFKELKNDIKTDILIIGGGIVGLTTLYYLKDYEDICLVDASSIGFGVTKNSTAKINYLQSAIYSDLEKNINSKTARNYLRSQKYAISLIKDIISNEKIDCDLESVTSLVYAKNNSDEAKLKKELEFLRENNILVEENFNTDYQSSYAISVNDTYVFNPIKYLNGLKQILKNKNIYENTKVTKIDEQNNEYICYANNYKIIAKKVIVACHYPFFIIPFFLPLKSHIEKSYIIAHKVQQNEYTTGITVSNPGFSYRFYSDGKNIYKICLAASHNTAWCQNDEKNFLRVQKLFNIKSKDIVAKWSNVDIITDDKMPYIGQIKNNLYIATGFNTWGMTNGVLAAKIISDNILNNFNPYTFLFNLKRMNMYKIKSFFSNSFTSLIAFISSKKKNKSWYKSNLEIKKINGKSIGIYTDEKGKKHNVYTTCPHMKCSLIFNELEHTWDCPCHSSRFSLDGKCIKGPSKYDISYKE